MIRKLIVDDILDIQEIVQTTWQENLQDILPVKQRISYLQKTYSEIMLRARMEKTIFYVYLQNEKPIGYINFTNVDEDGDVELLAIHVLPQYQKQGIGTQLFQVMLKAIQEEAQQVLAYLDINNEYATQYYEQLHFRQKTIFADCYNDFPTKTIEFVLLIQNSQT